jgi:hypothetical protein
MFIGVANLIPLGLQLETSNINSGILAQDVEKKGDIEPRLCFSSDGIQSDQHTSGPDLVLLFVFSHGI